MPSMENAHALIVGIANYQQIPALPESVLADAGLVRDVLADPKLCAYPPANVEMLLDHHATQETMRAAFQRLVARTDADSTVFIYFTGHGGQVSDGPQRGEYLLPVDVVYTSEEQLAATAISGDEFTKVLQSLPARKLLVIFDACHSGGIGQAGASQAVDAKSGLSENYYDKLKSGRGRVILASSRSSEYSFVMADAENSLFTGHLVAGLKGGAIGVSGVIRILDLFSYVQPKVVADQPQQHPILKAEIEENFPVARYPVALPPTPIPAESPSDPFQADVFIVHHMLPAHTGQKSADQVWVKKVLAKGLKAQGLTVLTPDYIPGMMGASQIDAWQAGIERSRYTLVILSPGFLESSFADFQATMAAHLSLEESSNRVLLALKEPCHPALKFRFRYMLDMTDEDEFEENMERLAFEFKQEPGKL
ncbi:MAG: caspase family protein [Caldilineaceae bacterium]|nr:caspase family protein [Caldilineaceae bacterium]MBP8108459.1 caspase family protein [Caldilineaceae bacterium]MBP8124607.1 caspase family protein [Caldilineaceae bacterium]MBP9074369.1 caspase family protein [Caldilineaceae bacterium]